MDATTYPRSEDSMSDSGFWSSSPAKQTLSDSDTLSNASSILLPLNLSLLDIRDASEKSLASSENLATLVLSTLTAKDTVFPVSSALFDKAQNGSTSRYHTSGCALESPEDYGKKDVLIRSIPQLVLYDDRGLEIFSQITHVPEYYVTHCEIQILKDQSNEIVSECIGDGGVVVELGAGCMRKVKYLLDAIVNQEKTVTYYALDLSEQSLTQSLTTLAETYPTINFVGLVGTYDDSLLYIQSHLSNRIPNTSRTFIWLGTSIGNTTREEAAAFLKNVNTLAMEKGDTFLCGIDRRNPASVVKLAYDDPLGVTRDFVMNGLRHVERMWGHEEDSLLRQDMFEYVSLYNAELGRHEAYYRSLDDQCLVVNEESPAIQLEKGELVMIEYSVKYDAKDIHALMKESGLVWVKEWVDTTGRYGLHNFSK